jgi:hypothetical protein
MGENLIRTLSLSIQINKIKERTIYNKSIENSSSQILRDTPPSSIGTNSKQKQSQKTKPNKHPDPQSINMSGKNSKDLELIKVRRLIYHGNIGQDEYD